MLTSAHAAWGLVLKFGSSSRRRSRGVDVLVEKGLAHMQCTMMYRDQPLPKYKITASGMETLQIGIQGIT